MGPILSDAELVREALDGSRAALDCLLDRYWSSAVQLAHRRVHNHAEAEDAVQDAFLLAFRRLPQLRAPERFGGWLFTIVARTCVERARKRRPMPMEDVEILDAGGVRASEGLGGPEVRDQIQDAIADLPDRYRAVVVLRYGQELSVKEIAETLGIPSGTVVSHMFRANRILRQRLKHLMGSE